MKSIARSSVVVLFLVLRATHAGAGEDWLQCKFDERNSGNVPNRSVRTPLGLVAAVPLSDAVFTSPVVADGKVFVVDGSGAAYCIDAETFQVDWRFQSRGDAANCSKLSSPAIVGENLHFGTTAGRYLA